MYICIYILRVCKCDFLARIEYERIPPVSNRMRILNECRIRISNSNLEI